MTLKLDTSGIKDWDGYKEDHSLYQAPAVLN